VSFLDSDPDRPILCPPIHARRHRTKRHHRATTACCSTGCSRGRSVSIPDIGIENSCRKSGWPGGCYHEQANSCSWIGCEQWRWAGCQAAIAGKPAPTGGLGVGSWRFGRLSGRLREQARSHSGNGCWQLETGRLSGRPSLAGLFPQKAKQSRQTACFSPLNRMSVSSAVALDLAATCRPHRQAEWRGLSGVGQRPFGVAKRIERRCSEANRGDAPG
jgi:hypothetical protein